MFQSSSTHVQHLVCPSLTKSKLIIDEKYILKKLIHKYEQYYVCEGIDLTALKLVTIYLKPENSQFNFSKKIKEELRSKISPQILWSGNYKIQKNKFNIQIHEKYGPSLKSMFTYIKKPISHRDFLLLMFQLIRVVQKYANVGFVYRQLDMNNIVLGSKPQKNDVYLRNVFSLKKKGEEGRLLNTRFCSKGAHLGLKPFIKDDLQSVCYILLNIYMQDQFLKNVQTQQYYQCKNNIDFNSLKQGLPPLFIDFYNYVMNLNYNDQVNFFKWRNIIYQLIGRQSMYRPFQWMIKQTKTQVLLDGVDQSQIEDEIGPQDECINDKIRSIKLIKRGII